MVTINQKQFGGPFLIINKLFFLLLFLVIITNTTAHTDPSKLFLIVHDEECKNNLNIVDALLETKFLCKAEAAKFEGQLSALIKQTRAERLDMSPVSEDENDVGCSLSAMSWEDRRDHIIAGLNFLIREKLSRYSCSNKTASASNKFLKHVAMDVIDDALLPDGQVFSLTLKLPCLAIPPERSKDSHLCKAPNDFNPEKQWYLTSPPVGIGATDAWKCQNGQRSGPVIAVFDTGCSPNPDMERNICSCKEDCFGYSVGDGNPYSEGQIHGTMVSGHIAGVGNNKYGATGVCWGCRIMCIKVAHNWGPGIAEGIDHVVSKKHLVRITNHSYIRHNGPPNKETRDPEGRSMKKLLDAGILVVAAAGNDNCNMERYFTRDCLGEKTKEPVGNFIPGDLNFDNVLVVGASDKNNKRAVYSNYGRTKVDLFAPGNDLLFYCNTVKENCETKHMDWGGTSSASPIVAGAAALIWAQDPDMDFREVKRILMETVRPVDGFDKLCISGGILNLGAAMKEVAKKKPCRTPSYDLIDEPEGDRTADFNTRDFCRLTPKPAERLTDEQTADKKGPTDKPTDDEEERDKEKKAGKKGKPKKRTKRRKKRSDDDASARCSWYISSFSLMISLSFIHDWMI